MKDIKALKNSVSVETVLGHYGLLESLTPKHDDFFGPWPIHNGDNPRAFHINGQGL